MRKDEVTAPSLAPDGAESQRGSELGALWIMSRLNLEIGDFTEDAKVVRNEDFIDWTNINSRNLDGH